MRFLLGLGLGFLVPLGVRAMLKSDKPVVLEAIQGGQAQTKVEEKPTAKAEESTKKPSASSATKTTSLSSAEESKTKDKQTSEDKTNDQESQG